MKNQLLVCLTILLLLLQSGCNSSANREVVCADYPYYATAREAVDDADLIFSGTITKIEGSELDVRRKDTKDNKKLAFPYILFTVQIDKMYKGDLTHRDIENEEFVTVKLLDTGKELEVSEKGKYFFLAESYGKMYDTYPSLINPNQSVFDISTGEAFPKIDINDYRSPDGSLPDEKDIPTFGFSMQDVISECEEITSDEK